VNDKALGERSTRGYIEILEKEGLLATLFVLPTDLEASHHVYRQAAEGGHEVALHVHPADLGYEEFLGVYGFDDQCKILEEAADRFAQVMGRRPQSVCVGYQSANDHTFPAFVDVGYRQGNCSQPSRILPECASVWAGALPGIHYANACNRLLPGTLDFVNIPATNDPESRMWGGRHPQDLRVELVDAKNHWYTIAKNVDRQLNDEVPVKHLQIATHNIFDYSDPKNFRRETLEKMIGHVRSIIADKSCTLKPATIESTATEFRRIEPLAEKEAFKLTLDTRGR
jgi:peptidoglycan/xylan/chitin deacetylase (PgdA/CDA1 family)